MYKINGIPNTFGRHQSFPIHASTQKSVNCNSHSGGSTGGSVTATRNSQSLSRQCHSLAALNRVPQLCSSCGAFYSRNYSHSVLRSSSVRLLTLTISTPLSSSQCCCFFVEYSKCEVTVWSTRKRCVFNQGSLPHVFCFVHQLGNKYCALSPFVVKL